VRIETARLDLLPLDIGVLRDIGARRLEAVAAALGADVPPSFPDGVPAELRIAQLERDPAEQPWLVRAIVLRDERRVVGAAGFHSPPDPGGRAELGYEVVEGDRRRGFAREAVAALMEWAAATGSVKVFRAAIAPENTASQALVASLGFERVGEQIDPEDGLEWVFERSP
jgi:[ribosomal protein S5]-alanine N-acetyltransferase